MAQTAADNKHRWGEFLMAKRPPWILRIGHGDDEILLKLPNLWCAVGSMRRD